MLALVTARKSSATEAGETRFMLPLGVLQLLAIGFKSTSRLRCLQLEFAD